MKIGSNAASQRLLSGLILYVFLLSGCSPLSPNIPQVPQNNQDPSDLFIHRSESEDGTLIEFYGFSRGYSPGETAAYNLNIHNGSSVLFETRYCLQLLDTEGIVSTLARDQFSLLPGEGFGTLVNFVYPENLTPGAYGLALVIPDRMAGITTVWLGDNDGGSVESWGQPSCP